MATASRGFPFQHMTWTSSRYNLNSLKTDQHPAPASILSNWRLHDHSNLKIWGWKLHFRTRTLKCPVIQQVASIRSNWWLHPTHCCPKTSHLANRIGNYVLGQELWSQCHRDLNSSSTFMQYTQDERWHLLVGLDTKIANKFVCARPVIPDQFRSNTFIYKFIGSRLRDLAILKLQFKM